MRLSPIYWLIALVMFGVEFASAMGDEDNPTPPPDKDKPPGKSRDWLAPVRGFVLRTLAQKGASIVKAFIRRKEVVVPVEVKVKKLTKEKMCCPDGFIAPDVEYNKDNIWKNFEAPETASYMFVSFPEMIGLLEFLLMALGKFAIGKGWGIANQEELRAIEAECKLTELGLGDSFNVMTLGTVVKRKCVSHSYCAPITHFSANVTTREREKRLTLHDLLWNPIFPGTYILVRVKPKK
ncbi:MAG: hypothetical protein HY226_04765 [Candidatus Vogelbacteria bacterium]|nr:hypothetical protein [Candidatus Vogelbacteria bacterium]